MLSGFRFVIGALLASAMLGVGSLGLYATVKLRHQAKAGPIESSRNLVFDDRVDWNQFYSPDSARLFEQLAPKASASEPAESSVPPAAGGSDNVVQQAAAQSAAIDVSRERPGVKSPGEPQPVTPAAGSEPRDDDHASNSVRLPAGATSPVAPGDLTDSAMPVVTNASATSAPAPATPQSAEPSATQAMTSAAPGVQGEESRTGIAPVAAPTPASPAAPSTAVWDEEPLLIPEDKPPAAMENAAGTSTTGSTTAADHRGQASPPPAPAKEATADTNPAATITPARKMAPKARPVARAREPDSDAPERVPRSRAVRRPHHHAPHYATQPYAPQYQYQPAWGQAPRAQYWQPYGYR
jgi:hypothetical protein